jgi:Erythromycin biosynthesis protein CIII-like, C-terminal domain/Erythromycin biosynthesis protein CIII-like, N-terminal domain
MRVLLTGLPIQSHLVPAMVPVAKALQRAGHEVAIATGSAVAAEIERRGIPVLTLPDVLAPEQVTPELLAKAGVKVSSANWRPEVTGPRSVPLFISAMTARFAANVIDAAKTWRPDLIVRETNEYGGYLAAEVLGLPLAVVDIAPLIVQLVPDLTEQLNILRDGLGLPSIDSFTHASGQLTAGLLPEQWYPAQLSTPAHRYYRVPPDPAVADHTPLVLASFGSNVQMLLATGSKLMSITVEALGSLPVRSVVALGSDQAVASWTGPRPANVHLAAFVQQRVLLGTCEVFVTHAGFSGVRESLSAGVPMVALPLFADQPANAARLDELGLGIQTHTSGLTPDTLAANVKRVLTEPAHRLAARTFQRRILGLQPLATFASDLESLI